MVIRLSKARLCNTIPPMNFSMPRSALGLFLAKILVIAAVYIVVGKIGLTLAELHENISLIWPASGIALVILLRLGYAYWPGIFLGAFLTNVTTTAGVFTSLGIATGDTLEAYVGTFLLLRVGEFSKSLNRLRDVLALVFLGGMVATLVSAVVGVTSLGLASPWLWSDYGRLMLDWWLGDMLGVVVLSPFLLTWTWKKPDLGPLFWRKFVEVVLMAIILVTMSFIVFSAFPSMGELPRPYPYALFPLFIWAALRFGPSGASKAILLITIIAAWSLHQAPAPFFSSMSSHQRLLFLQGYMVVISLSTLILAAITRESRLVQERMKELGERRLAFASMVSHELRTPLSSIKAGIDMTLRGMDGPINDSQRETLGISKNNVDRLARLVDDILDYAQLESGGINFNFEKTDMGELIEEVFKFMQLEAKKKAIKFSLFLPPDFVEVFCDKDKIKTVLINLIHNSIKFTEVNGRINLRLILHKYDSIAIQVEDSGKGIAKEDLPYIFDLFRRGPHRAGGFGLGLAVCKLIVERHGGEIFVESSPEQGSLFHVVIPRNPPSL